MNIGMVSLCVVSGLSGAALGDVPRSFGWPMEHIMITLDNGVVGAHSNTDEDSRIQMMRFEGESYDGASSVLTDRYYSDQYGWVPDGFISLGSGEFLWIERSATSAGLDVYEGGMRPMRENHTYDSILGTDGADDGWMWSGTMTHNWYAVDALGEYDATYDVYVGDIEGNRLSGYTSASVTLYFQAVPAPSALGVLGCVGVGALRRRR